jgi:hypothetical protein
MEMPPLATPADLALLTLAAEKTRKARGRPKRVIDVDPAEVIKLHLYGLGDVRIHERLEVPLEWIGRIVRAERKRLGLKPRIAGRPRGPRFVKP